MGTSTGKTPITPWKGSWAEQRSEQKQKQRLRESRVGMIAHRGKGSLGYLLSRVLTKDDSDS